MQPPRRVFQTRRRAMRAPRPIRGVTAQVRLDRILGDVARHPPKVFFALDQDRFEPLLERVPDAPMNATAIPIIIGDVRYRVERIPVV